MTWHIVMVVDDLSTLTIQGSAAASIQRVDVNTREANQILNHTELITAGR